MTNDRTDPRHSLRMSSMCPPVKYGVAGRRWRDHDETLPVLPAPLTDCHH